MALLKEDEKIWIGENRGDISPLREPQLLAGREGRGGYSVALMLEFIEQEVEGFDKFRKRRLRMGDRDLRKNNDKD